MKKEYTKEEARSKVEAFCSAAEHCIYEVESKLDKMQISSKVKREIIEHLLKERYIDERRFAKFFIRDKYRFNKWGRMKIIQALRLKRIPTEIIQGELGEIDEVNYDDNLKSLLIQKNRNVKAANDYERRGKLIRFAIGRGFEMNVIVKTLENMGLNEEDDF